MMLRVGWEQTGDGNGNFIQNIFVVFTKWKILSNSLWESILAKFCRVLAVQKSCWLLMSGGRMEFLWQTMENYFDEISLEWRSQVLSDIFNLVLLRSPWKWILVMDSDASREKQSKWSGWQFLGYDGNEIRVAGSRRKHSWILLKNFM